jgi:alkanesulfonate monooxygenase
VKLAVALAWHTLAWEDLLDLVQRAEALGFAAVYVDGDVTMLGRRREADVLHGWTVTTALLARTSRIQIGSIRLVHHWNAAHLAQAAASAERMAPGRLRFFVSIGDRPEDPRFGYPRLSAGERIAWLDETLSALRALWRGECVTLSGRHVELDAAQVRPLPPGGRIPIEIGARDPRLLEVVARHGDVWNVNLPPIAARVAEAGHQLARACAGEGRQPDEIGRSMWIFTRVQERPDPAAALAEFRRLNPWFAEIPDAEIAASLVYGDGARCRSRLASIAADLGLDLPVADLSGVDAQTARRSLDALGASAPPR